MPSTPLTLDASRRYARNIILPEIGEAGQEKLLAARVLMIGAGGLGCAALQYLAAAGVGTLGVIDGDRVELSNLQRQILFEHGDIGRLKVEAARDRLEELNPDVKIDIYPYEFSSDPHSLNPPYSSRHPERSEGSPAAPEDANAILRRYGLVADGCDNFATRFLVADLCERHRKPLVSAAVSGFHGQLSTFTPYLGTAHPRYRDFVPDAPPEADTCTETGVVGAACGILGAMQALEIVKIILGQPSLSGTLLRYDGLSHALHRTVLRRVGD
jgi:adenylyltransferase/sulfurtransferase